MADDIYVSVYPDHSGRGGGYKKQNLVRALKPFWAVDLFGNLVTPADPFWDNALSKSVTITKETS